jgi:predicted nucleotidyltransferase
MGQDKILKLFFENPAEGFQIRGIAKSLNIPKSSVSYQMQHLVKKGIVLRKETGVFPYYAPNTESEKYRFYKLQDAIERIIDSGLLDHLEKETNPRCIILFGSFAKAEYDADSDIDIFIQAAEKTLDLAKFEKKLKHPINALFAQDLNKISAELFNNIINGIKLRGFIKIKS